MPNDLNEVEPWEAEKIWAGNCPCGGALLVGPKGGLSVNVKCEKGGRKFNVGPRPFLPQNI